MNKFQNELKEAIHACCRAKPVRNNEDVKLWKEQHELALQKLESLIARCMDKDDIERLCKEALDYRKEENE